MRVAFKNHKRFSKTETDIFGAISLYTGGHVASVRDPAKFKKEKASSFADSHYLTGGLRTPEVDDYRMANHVLTILANRSYNGPAYRGIKVPDDPAFFAGLKQGVEFPSWPISSFSRDPLLSRSFATMDIKDDQAPLVISVHSLAKGAYIEYYTNYEGEEEIVSSTRLKILRYFTQEKNPSDRHSLTFHHLVCESM